MRAKAASARRTAFIGILGALAIALSFFENALMGLLDFAIPGVKPGIANIAVVLALHYFGGWCALAVALLKALATFLATGAVTALWFSLAGSLLSAAGMWALSHSPRFSLAGVSALGGFLGNLGQLSVMMLLGGSFAYAAYLPVLAASGVLFGLLMGIVAGAVAAALPLPPTAPSRNSRKKSHAA